MLQSLFITLVHNNNHLRNDYIKPQLDNFALLLTPYFSDIKKIEISFQPEVKSHSKLFAFLRDVIYMKLAFDWARYRLLSFKYFLSYAAFFTKSSIKKYFFGRKTSAPKWQRNSAIEVFVTAKHIRSWERFLDGNSDFLICFEDDAIFKEDSHQNFINLINRVDFEGPTYIDLAGGCLHNELQIDNLEKNSDEFGRYYKKPVTNTACAYLMNRKLVLVFYNILVRRPWLRLIGVDWMMNSLFIHMEKEGMKCTCVHTNPTIFKHGTTTGEYSSWQANDQQ